MSDARAVYVVDDEESIRKSLSFALRTTGHAVTTFAGGTEFLREARGLRPGCVLLDVRMPDMDGLEVQREMAARGIALPVVVLTGHGDVGIAVQAMKAGAVDFLEKPFEQAVLARAIDAAFARLAQREAGDQFARDCAVRIAGLTPREQDVLRGLADGLPNKSIAFDLGISARTVEVHRAHLMEKMGVSSLSELLRIAFAAGLGAPAR